MTGSASAFQTTRISYRKAVAIAPQVADAVEEDSILNLLADGNVPVTLDCSYFEADFGQAPLLAQSKYCRMAELAHKSRPLPRTGSSPSPSPLLKHSSAGKEAASSAVHLLQISSAGRGHYDPSHS